MRKDAEIPPARLRRRKYMNVSMVIIDEVGFEPMSRKDASLLFRLVSYRYGARERADHDEQGDPRLARDPGRGEVLATAILDRLLHRSHVLNIKGRSYRLRDLERAVTQAGGRQMTARGLPFALPPMGAPSGPAALQAQSMGPRLHDPPGHLRTSRCRANA